MSLRLFPKRSSLFLNLQKKMPAFMVSFRRWPSVEKWLEWGVSGNLQKDAHLEFRPRILEQQRDPFLGNRTRRSLYANPLGCRTRRPPRWHDRAFCLGRELRRSLLSTTTSMNERCKHIAPRFSHLPSPQALLYVPRPIGNRWQSLTWQRDHFLQYITCLLYEGVRYQCLRFGVPTAGNCAHDIMIILQAFRWLYHQHSKGDKILRSYESQLS